MDGQVIAIFTLGCNDLHTCESLMRALTSMWQRYLLKYPSVVQFATVKRFVEKLHKISKYFIIWFERLLHNGSQAVKRFVKKIYRILKYSMYGLKDYYIMDHKLYR